MSKIDLSKAKVGDKFRTRGGRIATFHGRFPKSIIGLDYYVKIGKDIPMRCFVTGMWLPDEETQDDLVEQVFDDEKDRAITDKILKDVEKVVNGVTQAMPLIESATIANLYREPLPENNEDNSELQRRQEVIALAEKLVVNEEMMKAHKDLFEAEVYAHAKTQTTYPAFVIRSAEDFIKYKNQYLKEGKL